MFYVIVEVKKVYQKTCLTRFGAFPDAPLLALRVSREGTMNANKLLWRCAKNKRHWMNQKMAYCEEYESRLRQTESADVAAGTGVRAR